MTPEVQRVRNKSTAATPRGFTGQNAKLIFLLNTCIFFQYFYGVFCLWSVRSALISGVYHEHIQQPDADALCASFCSAYKTLISSELISPAHSTDRKQMSLISCVCPRQRAGTMRLHLFMHTDTTIQHKITPQPTTYQDTRTAATDKPQINKPGFIHTERNKPEVNNKHNKC